MTIAPGRPIHTTLSLPRGSEAWSQFTQNNAFMPGGLTQRSDCEPRVSSAISSLSIRLFPLPHSSRLQGMDYGCLPFELFRVLALLSLGAFFSLVMWFNRSTLLPVHKMIIGVVALGTVEACCWLVAYSYMNSTGECVSQSVSQYSKVGGGGGGGGPR